jgi:hypothetical protein
MNSLLPEVGLWVREFIRAMWTIVGKTLKTSGKDGF